MKKQFQTIISNVDGDCMRACVATITGVDIHEIPNFAAPENQSRTDKWLKAWAEDNGWCVIEPKADRKPTDYSYWGLLGMVAMATVPSQMFDCKHAVVIGWREHPKHEGAYECYVVHDPNPNNKPYENVRDIVERVQWIVPRPVWDDDMPEDEDTD